jgi:hypothetical protein
MIRAAVYEGALERFAGEIEHMIDSRGMGQYKGTGVLDDVQREIDSLVETHHRYITRPIASMDVIANDFNRTKIRVELLLNEKVKQKAVGLGSALPQVPIGNDPQWAEVLAHAQRHLERFTAIYSAQISTLPSVDKKKLDFQLEDVLLNVEKAFKANPSSTAAQAHMAYIDQTFASLNDRFSKYANFTMQKNLQNLVEQKSAERLALASQIKMSDDRLNNNERVVVGKSSGEVLRVLAELKSDSASFNTALRNQKLAIIDKHLDVLRKVVDSLQFRDNLSGGQFMSAKRQTRAFYGFGDLPGKRYPSVRGGGRPFLNAPSRTASRGLGSAFPTATLDDPPQKIADVLAENLQTAQGQGMLNLEHGAMLLRQTNMLTIGAFGGDSNELDQAKTYYREQIEKLMNNQKVFASNNAGKSEAILRSNTDGGSVKPLTTVQPTYGQYARTYLGYPVIGLMALGGVLAVMKLRSNKTSTRPDNKGPTKPKKKTRFKFKKPKFSGKGLMPAISGLKGGRHK